MDTGSQGFLILGERRTGNSSLELYIAARARLPIFNIKDQNLEAGLWVLQRESKVRERFQTASELDHEAFINQLLVELDGFAKHDGVVRMATTGNLNQFDNALQQPGRMDRVFHLQWPPQSEREKILNIAAKEILDNDLNGYEDRRKVAENSTVRPLELKLAPVLLEGSAFRSKFLDAYDELMSYTSWFATFSAIIPEGVWKTKIMKKLSKMLVNNLELTLTTEELPSVVDLMEPYGQISNSTALCMGNNHKYDADEFMSYSSCFTTFSTITPERVRKIKMLVNHLGLTLPNEDLQSVVILCKFLVATHIDDSPAKSHFNDLIGKCLYGQESFIVFSICNRIQQHFYFVPIHRGNPETTLVANLMIRFSLDETLNMRYLGQCAGGIYLFWSAPDRLHINTDRLCLYHPPIAIQIRVPTVQDPLASNIVRVQYFLGSTGVVYKVLAIVWRRSYNVLVCSMHILTVRENGVWRVDYNEWREIEANFGVVGFVPKANMFSFECVSLKGKIYWFSRVPKFCAKG